MFVLRFDILGWDYVLGGVRINIHPPLDNWGGRVLIYTTRSLICPPYPCHHPPPVFYCCIRIDKYTIMCNLTRAYRCGVAVIHWTRW